MTKSENINGIEIIDFLNYESANNEEFDDQISGYNLSANSFTFEDQKISEGKYTLEFNASFNNWGTDQIINDNYIHVKDGKCRVSLNEPFEDASGILEIVLQKWLDTHEFMDAIGEFSKHLEYAYEQLPIISFDSKPELQKIIDELVKAKTYMK